MFQRAVATPFSPAPIVGRMRPAKGASMRISGLHIFEVTKPNMISVHFRTAVLACLLTLPSATGAQTLDKIKNNGTVTIGYFDFQVPISYADASKSAIGYHIQVCEAIVEKAKETLGLSKLKE